MKLDNLSNFKKSIQAQVSRTLAKPEGKTEDAVVGYTANYAVYVHEDLEAKHGADYNSWYGEEISAGKTKSGKTKKGWKGKTSRGPQQQAKFLEQPARQLTNSGTLANDVAQAMRRGETLQDSLMVAAHRILRESQRIVPVDKGNLRGSGFVAKE